ncbi:methylated-DNA--[protein]-cysteine S-methyltransferase [Changpingibacter yushuensis]|uniref:methylated-DNA--[protein]-cysteine S-methyltransferase n=1 Tax=Changpingibacter yushuensis TaxID=2758440 RepID=UPI0015F3C1B8|nr:methylated-DNA--[protein]-cysteine S-methyltransferase [Changpingibacter yushuensis]
MTVTRHYPTPIGTLALVSDGTHLLSCDFVESSSTKVEPPATDVESPATTSSSETEPAHDPVLDQTVQWLDEYLAGNNPSIADLPLRPAGTEFRQKVWDILRTIPYGGLMTYGEIAKLIAQAEGKSIMSSRAVGGAVGHNPLPIIVPCHRVVGGSRNLTGYSGGMDRKIWLLRHEGVELAGMRMPDGSTLDV